MKEKLFQSFMQGRRQFSPPLLFDRTKSLRLWAVALFCSFCTLSAYATIGGSGTASSPYTINSAADLATFKGYVENTNSTYIGDGKYWRVTANITWSNGSGVANRIGWDNKPFRGTFDGDGHTISFSTISNIDDEYTGFFGQTNNATIKNLTISYSFIDTRSIGGGLIGEAKGSTTLENVHVRGSSTSDIYGCLWGGLIGQTYSATTVNISFCSVIISEVRLREPSESYFDAGGLIGKLDASGTSCTITDCLADVGFSLINSSSSKHSIGGIIGSVAANVTLRRVFSGSTIPSPGSTYRRGHIVGYIGSGKTVTAYSTMNRVSAIYVGYNEGTWTGAGNDYHREDVWTSTPYIYNQLERANNTGGSLGSDTRGNEKWGYDLSTRPKLSKTGYAVRVTRGTNIAGITGHRYTSGTYHYVNADEQLTVTTTFSPTAHQRIAYTFAPAYSPSSGSAYSATMSGNNWRLYAKTDGTVSAAIVNVPYPATINGSFDQWTKEATVSWTYDNPQNLTGKFYLYRRQTAPTSEAWTLTNSSGTSVANGSSKTMSQPNTLTASDYGKTFEYCAAFVEGTGSAPTTPPSDNNKATVSVNTTPALGTWTVTATGGETSIAVSFTADSRFTNSTDYKYTVQRSVNGGAYADWLASQSFSGATSYSHTNTDLSSNCDVYRYRVVITAFNTTFSKESGVTSITGATKFVADQPFKATKGEHANYVRLQWKVDKQTGGSSETFRIFRRVANTGDDYTEMETVTSNAATVYWNDNNALTGVYYEYKVTLYQTCSGNETEADSKFDIGFTQAFGTVSGRVTYGTGSSVQSVNMLVRRSELQEGESQYRSLKSTGGGQKFEWLADQTYFNNIWTSQKWTLQFWVNPDGTNTGTATIGYLGSYPIYMAPATGGYQIYTLGGTSYKSEVIPANHYSHIAITRDGDNVKIYTVCDQNADSIYIRNTPFAYSTASTLSVADSKISFGHELKGNIDEVRFWSRPLSEAEITRDYSRILVGNESGLKAYWTFDDALTGYAFDMSRAGTVYNGNHATTNTLVSDATVPNETYQLALKGITDSDGNYQISGIPYVGEGTSYSVVPSMGVHVFNPTQQLRYISPTSMVHNATDFTDISSFTVSGTVTYEGGTYPVQGCSFEIDDQTLTRPNGEVVTSDYEGNFTISVPIGIHKVRVVKQGHTFANDGYLKDETTGANLNYNAPVANIKFFDQTRVKLIGRVVGGLIENDKPLGFGESQNNIGVQTVKLENTRQQYDFASVTVSETFSHNQGQWRKPGSLTDDQTTVDYNQDDITIHVSPTTGEFVAMVYPEPYNIASILVPGDNSTQVTVYSNNEMLDLSTAAVPNDSYLKTSVRTWKDSTFVANRPGVVDHWEYGEQSDTVRYHAEWKYYYQATPTFSVTQLVNNEPVDYFGEKTFALKDENSGETETLNLYDETGQTYLFGKPVFRQGTEYTFRMNAYEEYTNYVSGEAETTQYPVKEGKVNMTNNIRLAPEPETIEMDSVGVAVYRFLAGAPNLTTATNDFFATLSLGAVSYYWSLTPNNSPIEAWHLGEKSTGTNFMTSGPDQLTAILRDPPGTGSYAYIESGTSIVSTSALSVGATLTEELNLTSSLGADVITWAGVGAGVIVETGTKADLATNLSSEQSYSYENETSVTTTFTERFETSGESDYVGAAGDVFIGNSTNILYGLTNGVQIKKGAVSGEPWATQGEYKIAPSSAIAYGQDFDTRFAYTTMELEDIMIPKWKQSIASRLLPAGTPAPTGNTAPVYVSKLDPSDENYGKWNLDEVFKNSPAFDRTKPYDGASYTIYFPASWTPSSTEMQNFLDSVLWANNQIGMWHAVLAQNEKEKVEMQHKGNYSFGGGATIEYSEATASSTSYSHNWGFNITPTIGITTGAEVNGVGIEIETNVSLAVETGGSEGGSTETSKTTGFVLSEDGTSDEITVDYGMTASATFAFKTRGGQTSCPYEGEVRSKYYQPGNHILSEATMQIEVPKIQVTSAPSVLNVPANRTATFTLGLQNESETGEDVWFQVVVDEETNPNGAELKIDGAAIANGRLFLVKAGETLQKTLTLGKGTADSYENIGIILQSQCDDISDITYVSAEFVPACSEVAISSPSNNFIVNADSPTGDTLYVTINGYDVNFPNFGYIRLEYRPISSPNWQTLKTFYPSALYPNAQGTETTKEDIGTRSTIVYPWKMPEADGQYELRATAASVNISDNTIMGDPLSTYSSAAITGYKDMARPTALGNPSPVNGILGAGDELSITFNEDIQTGMLTQNNFSISGVLNAQTIAEPNVGLSFDGTGQAYTELPIYAGGSFSIETWFKRNLSTAGTLFAYGANGNYISLGFDTDSKAVLKIGDETYTSATAIANDDTWKYVALVFNRNDNTVSVYEYEGVTNNTLFTGKALVTSPETQGKLYVGNNVATTDGFEGAVSQLHFYGANRTQAAISADKSLTKSGSEYDLAGYWFMDEGEGAVAVDKARARNLVLNTGWYIYPSGKAIALTGNNFVEIPTSTYALDAFSNFTLEFWFKGGSQINTTLFCGNEGSIGFDATGQLVLYKPDGTLNQTLCPAGLTDNEWHHFALSVKRRGAANVYIDGTARAVFNSDLLGSFASGFYTFGAKRATDNTYSQHFTGNVDEIRIWNSALTRDAILLNKNSKLRGDEKGLQAYYPFETYYKQSNGLITVTATMNNISDASVASGTAATGDIAVAVKDVRPVEEVPFTFVSSSNKIVFTLDNTYFSRVENVTLNITVSDILDMHSNKSNAENWIAYVNRNPLNWATDRIDLAVEHGASQTFKASITNSGGVSADYYIDNLPSWLSVNSVSGTLQPLVTKELTFTVSSGINIGSYEASIVLTGTNDVQKILPVLLKVTGARPDWSVNPNDYEFSMNVVGRVQIMGAYQEDEDDIIGAFIGDLCVGVGSPEYISSLNAYYLFLDVYGNSEHKTKPVIFKLWDAGTGRIYPQVTTSVADITFVSSAIVGTIADPVLLNATDIMEQSIELKKGWTWMSANVLNTNPSILDQMKTSLNDVGLKIQGRTKSVSHSTAWVGALAAISEKEMYNVNLSDAHTLILKGTLANPLTTSVQLINGWSWIGYTPAAAMPVKTALAGINAVTGDQIKAQSKFAQYAGVSGWIGTLKDMQPGLGYQYYSNGAATTFTYPNASALRSMELRNAEATVEPKWTVDVSRFSGNMTVTAIVLDDETEVHSDLVEIAAFSGDECRGSVLLEYVEGLDKPYLGFLTISGEAGDNIRFKVYDHGKEAEYAASGPVNQFTADGIYGDPLNPKTITFNSATGIESINGALRIYPNPVKDILYIEHGQAKLDRLEIFGITGQTFVREDNFAEQSIRVSQLAAGVYVLKVTINGETSVHKFIKQ